MPFDPLSFVSDINAALSRTKDVRANIRTCLDEVVSRLLALNAFLFIFDQQAERLVLASASGLGVNEFRKLDSKAAHDVFSCAFENGTAQSIELPSASPDFAFVSPEGPASMFLAPVEVAGACEGILGVVFGSADGGMDDADRLLLLIASMIGQSLRIERAARGERERLIEENTLLRHELREKYDFSHIVGTSNPMRQVYDQVTQVARSNATVLLRGESGTGKEMIANAIHYNSLRSKRPFVKINCAALPDTLIESELFGHEKGAFTGADR
ncbi:MAG TPA: sigma 54-interacting transcriptional regulator, partial [Pyrinomonadaceae bacterium]|nr:sigma 54-interacting transcriptional regulator [Pyrinomonadaceae bacterium]